MPTRNDTNWHGSRCASAGDLADSGKETLGAGDEIGPAAAEVSEPVDGDPPRSEAHAAATSTITTHHGHSLITAYPSARDPSPR
jgi:hypothetical protein